MDLHRCQHVNEKRLCKRWKKRIRWVIMSFLSIYPYNVPSSFFVMFHKTNSLILSSSRPIYSIKPPYEYIFSIHLIYSSTHSQDPMRPRRKAQRADQGIRIQGSLQVTSPSVYFLVLLQLLLLLLLLLLEVYINSEKERKEGKWRWNHEENWEILDVECWITSLDIVFCVLYFVVVCFMSTGFVKWCCVTRSRTR